MFITFSEDCAANGSKIKHIFWSLYSALRNEDQGRRGLGTLERENKVNIFVKSLRGDFQDIQPAPTLLPEAEVTEPSITDTRV